MPTLFICFIVFILWMQVKMKHANKTPTWDAAYWRKEKDANFARKKDISNLAYLEVQRKRLPFQETSLPELIDVQAQMQQILSQPILNLHTMSNADMKLQYGVANFEYLSACDQNFIRLLRCMNQWGQILYQKGQSKEAMQLLEYAVELGSDISKTYLTLGELYQKEGSVEKINDLIQKLSQSDSLLKDATIRQLTQLLQSYTD